MSVSGAYEATHQVRDKDGKLYSLEEFIEKKGGSDSTLPGRVTAVENAVNDLEESVQSNSDAIGDLSDLTQSESNLVNAINSLGSFAEDRYVHFSIKIFDTKTFSTSFSSNIDFLIVSLFDNDIRNTSSSSSNIATMIIPAIDFTSSGKVLTFDAASSVYYKATSIGSDLRFECTGNDSPYTCTVIVPIGRVSW